MKRYNTDNDGNYKYSTGEDLESVKVVDNIEIGVLDPLKFNFWNKKQYPHEIYTKIDLALYEEVKKIKEL